MVNYSTTKHPKISNTCNHYRQLSEAIDKFVDDFSNCLEKLTSGKRTFYILGDININISESNSGIQANNYINTITSNGAFNMITKPTRLTPISATLIDHMVTSDITHTIVPLIILSDLTDHYPVPCSIKQFKSLKSSSSNVHYYGDRKNFCREMFCVELNNSLLQLISTNLPLYCENFNETLTILFLFIFIFTHNQLEINHSACRNKDCE